MPATQISFASFALAQQALLSTPPAIAAEPAALVVAHGAGVGECPAVSIWLPKPSPWSREMREDFFDPRLFGLWGGYLDAPEWLPAGGHTSFVSSGRVLLDGFSYRR